MLPWRWTFIASVVLCFPVAPVSPYYRRGIKSPTFEAWTSFRMLIQSSLAEAFGPSGHITGALPLAYCGEKYTFLLVVGLGLQGGRD